MTGPLVLKSKSDSSSLCVPTTPYIIPPGVLGDPRDENLWGILSNNAAIYRWKAINKILNRIIERRFRLLMLFGGPDDPASSVMSGSGPPSARSVRALVWRRHIPKH